LEDSDASKKFSKALKEAQEYFSDPPDTVNPKELARHVATMAANVRVLAKETKKNEKVLKESIDLLRSVKDVSIDRSQFENLSPKDLKDISDVLTSTAEQVDTEAREALSDDDAAKAFEERIKEATDYFGDDTVEFNPEEAAKHLATLTARQRILKVPTEVAIRNSKKIFKTHTEVEEARNAKAVFEDLSAPGKIRFVKEYETAIETAKKQVEAHLDDTATQAQKRAWENRSRPQRPFLGLNDLKVPM
jgi:hypothetical protein